jgi:predicted Zn-dependent peptidase
MVVAVAGNIEHGEVVQLIRRAFEQRLSNSSHEPSLRPDRRHAHAPATEVNVVADDTEQANIILGTLGMSRFDDRRFVLGVLSTAIGGGMSSRLFQQIREQRGLAYSTYSYTSGFAGDGLFGLYAGCQPGKADEVVEIMQSVLDSVGRDGLSEDELDRGKGQLRGGMVLGLEDSGSRMTRIGKAELCYGDVLGVDDLLELVDSVSLDQVNVLAEELACQPRCLTVVGPFGRHDFDAAVQSSGQ